MTTTRITRLTESALMMALSTALSFVQLIALPYGGSVTAVSTLPLILIAYRYGIRWGVFVGVTHGLLQLFLGLNHIMGVDMLSVIAIVLLDYLVAFGAMGLAGVCRNRITHQGRALAVGAVIGCAARYLCHLISGCTVWAAYNYTQLPTVAYSAVYNATYMLPETLITALAAYYIGSLLDFRAPTITRATRTASVDTRAAVLYGIGNTVILAAVAYDVLMVFAHLQSPDTGLFSVAALKEAPWLWMAGITVAAALVYGVCKAFANRCNPQ